MTTVDEARAALLAYDERIDSLILLADALIAAVRAERLADTLSAEPMFAQGYAAGRAESAETLRALREAALDLLRSDGEDSDKWNAIRAALAATPAEDVP